MKNYNQDLDQLLNDLELPSDHDLRRQTINEKISKSRKGKKTGPKPRQSQRMIGKNNPMAGKVHPNNGKTWSLGDGFKKKMEKVAQDRPSTMKVISPFGTFSSVHQCSKELGMDRNTILKNIKKQIPGWQGIRNKPNSTRKYPVKNPIKTPDGYFRGISHCQEYYQCDGNIIRKRLKIYPDSWYFVSIEEYKQMVETNRINEHENP